MANMPSRRRMYTSDAEVQEFREHYQQCQDFSFIQSWAQQKNMRVNSAVSILRGGERLKAAGPVFPNIRVPEGFLAQDDHRARVQVHKGPDFLPHGPSPVFGLFVRCVAKSLGLQQRLLQMRLQQGIHKHSHAVRNYYNGYLPINGIAMQDLAKALEIDNSVLRSAANGDKSVLDKYRYMRAQSKIIDTVFQGVLSNKHNTVKNKAVSANFVYAVTDRPVVDIPSTTVSGVSSTVDFENSITENADLSDLLIPRDLVLCAESDNWSIIAVMEVLAIAKLLPKQPRTALSWSLLAQYVQEQRSSV